MGNGNTRELVDTMPDEDKMKYLIQTGKVNDQMIQLYRDQIMTPIEIYEYAVGKRENQPSTNNKNKNIHKYNK
uniref:Uncharacterized protein n=1 Tax=viral metagenome TaxID=1070528 RepID=A0A6C0E4H2_9ZZZZ